MPKIIVVLQPDRFPTGRDVELHRELDFFIFREAYQHIDMPDRSAAGTIEEVFCTPRAIREQVLRKREELAQDLAKELTKDILEILSKQDTVTGYSK